MSLAPFPAHQRHTYTAGGAVHEAEYRELRVIVPDGATVGPVRGRTNGVGSKVSVSFGAAEAQSTRIRTTPARTHAANS